MNGMKGIGIVGRIANGSLVALAAVLAVALAFGPAQAVVKKVPADFATIQAAVDDAASGDTIEIKKCTPFSTGVCGPNGEYHEDVEIFGKSLHILCKGAVLDGAPEDVDPGAQLFRGFNVHEDADGDADGTVIEGCTVQHFDNDGIHVGGSHVDDVIIKNNTAIGNERYGIFVIGDDCEVTGNTAISNDNDGIRVGKNGGAVDGCLVEKNTAIGNDDDGIKVEGDNNIIRKNEAFRNDDEGIDVEGDKNLISRNKVEANESRGIEVDGKDNTIERNKARANASHGIDVDNGNGNKVDRNTSNENQDDGFNINGSDCDLATCGPITNNRAERNGDSGFDIDDFNGTSSKPIEVSGNKAKFNEDHGFECGLDSSTCDFVNFKNNRADKNGNEGFNVCGTDITHTNDKAKRNAEDGFKHNTGCSHGTVWDNVKSLNNGQDGIDIDDTGTGFVVKNSTIKNNAGTGIENNGTDTEIDNNTVTGNRTDIAGEGDSTDNCGSVAASSLPLDTTGGNTFKTGGATTRTANTGPFDSHCQT